MHEHLIVHGDLKGVGNRLVIPAACDMIVPTGKHPNKPEWPCLSHRLCTLQGRWCRCRLRSLRPHALGWEPSRDNSLEMCSMAKPRNCGGFQTNEGVRCVRLGDGDLRGPYAYPRDDRLKKMEPRQVLCGAIPFYNLRWPHHVMKEIMNGGRPAKPENATSVGFTGVLWKIVERCWLADTDARPTLEAVLSCLREAASSWGDRQKVV